MSRVITNKTVEGFAAFSRKVAAEGCVLLKNEDNILPLTTKDNVALFGRVQVDSYRSGTGSGGSVNVLYKTNILGGLQAKEITLNQEVQYAYEEWIKENPFDNGGGGWAAEPWHQKEMPLADELVEAASRVSNKAVIVIGRTAGEDQDNAAAEGSYLLTGEERAMIAQVIKYFKHVAVLFNVSNIIDTSWVEEEDYKDALKGLMYVWQGGMETGNAIADILVGDVTPSGKLTDTIAYSIEDYPSTANYGNEFRNDYEEDIYVGYRYFETFAPEKVQYPFGYGLSYTSFETQVLGGKRVADTIEVAIKVKNTGAQYSGREVVQIYVEAPQGELGKPAKELVGFTKTKDLAPGEEVVETIEVPVSKLASYDDSGVTGHPYSYVLEAGSYHIYAGTSVRQVERVQIDGEDTYEVEEIQVVETLQQALAPRVDLRRMKPGRQKEDGTYELTYEQAPQQVVCLKERVERQLPQTIKQTGDLGYKLQDVKKDKVSLDTFIGQLTNEELATIVRGEGMGSPLVTEGTASAFGGVTEGLSNYGIPVACTADGPSGIRMEGGGYATQLPIGTSLAATWDTTIVEELYELEGQELLLNEVDVLLGPGMNIRRSPLNGRNFEYYSEDPLITGCIAAAVVRGIAKSGTHGTLKHFACNNQEKYRSFVDAVASERCLREIYLKGFEIAVKEGNARSIMTAYNPINSYWSASNYDLTTTILRKEWGFKGIVMTDWWAKMNHIIDGGEAVSQNTAHMVKAQNDLYMVVTNFGAGVNTNNDNTMEMLASGELTVAELQQCARNICEFLMETPAFIREKKEIKGIKEVVVKTYHLTEQEKEALTLLRVAPSYDGARYMCVEEDGVYELTATLQVPHNSLTQVACNLVMNDKILTNIQTQGTDGKTVEHKLGEVALKKGIYKVHLERVKPQLHIQELVFELKK
ncbi:MAG: glycoside hydrolase family 3 protein [Cellulosilyticaceae bacterium]